MKNFKLLLGATALLSTALATNVMATPDDKTSTSLEMIVDLLSPWTIHQEMFLSFGTLIAKDNGVITISPNGDIDTGGMTLIGEDNHRAGEIRITGMDADAMANQKAGIMLSPDMTAEQKAEEIASMESGNIWLSLVEAEPLKDDVDNTPCGTVSDFEQVATLGHGVLVKIGATLTLPSDIEATIASKGRALTCRGYITATNILAE